MKDEEGEKTDFLCLRGFVGCKVTFAAENLMISDDMIGRQFSLTKDCKTS